MYQEKNLGHKKTLDVRADRIIITANVGQEVRSPSKAEERSIESGVRVLAL